MRRSLIAIALIVLVNKLNAQETFPVNGVEDKRVGIFAFTNAVIYKDYQTKLEGATLLIEEGRVSAVGQNVAIPDGAIVKDLDGASIYPALIDIYSDYGLPPVERKSFNFLGPQQFESEKEGPFAWNQTIRPETDATYLFTVDNRQADHWRKQGFGVALSHVKDGIARGASVLVTLADDVEQNVVIGERVSAHYSFDRGSSGQLYPTSIMGSVALLRQTYYDAEWYGSPLNTALNNQSLQAFIKLQGIPQIFDASHKLNIPLADKIGDEFGIQYIIKGRGDEYQRVEMIKKTRAPLIIPIDYPDAYDVEDPLNALEVSLADLKHWELAPTNPATLEKAGIDFAITPDGLKKPEDFWENLRKAVDHGLSESTAIKSLTFTPATLLRSVDRIGTLNTGSLANFFIASANIFDEESEIRETWIQGKPHFIKQRDTIDFAGKYLLKINDQEYDLEISGDPGTFKGRILLSDTSSLNVKTTFDGENISLSFRQGKEEGIVRLAGWKQNRNLKGKGQLGDGSWVDWIAGYEGPPQESKTDGSNGQPDGSELGKLMFPFVAYGWQEKPLPGTYLIKNTTVWTNEADGILENSDVLVRNGKIEQIGQNISFPQATEIDGTGKHLTSGIIDEHSHVALRGVNESSQAITAEVRMNDAIDSEDIDIYRQLAGGVTAAQLLHGSANPIGGQSALVKFRWGATPDEMRISGADGFIKFALGENVKHSNRPRIHNIRYPQTRMGVEQVFTDAFVRASAYNDKWGSYNGLSSRARSTTPKPRKDLELEALVEILNKQRFITCHSYVQSEINMLMKVADRFNFKVNTFTHILEGYKVADKMKEHGAGASTFSDWWAYKWEVKEAIPYNPALMNEVGVVTAINSDDSEMARRLNQEAAKGIKYGNMSEEDAWKMVTLNPARLLHLDDRMGSIVAGKDADLVLWSGHPLSIYSQPEKTMVDGIIYFDKEKDEESRKMIETERARLIEKILSSQKGKNSGSHTNRSGYHRELHCEDLTISNDYTDYE